MEHTEMIRWGLLTVIAWRQGLKKLARVGSIWDCISILEHSEGKGRRR